MKRTTARGRPRGLWAIFVVPLLLGAAQTFGLIAALLADGFWDAISWTAIGVTAAVALWFALRRQPGR